MLTTSTGVEGNSRWILRSSDSPLSPGRVRSRSTRWNVPARSCSSAEALSTASLMRTSNIAAARMRAMPWRTTGWSSTSRMLRRTVAIRKNDEDARAAAPAARDAHLSAERQRALAHAEQTHRPGVVHLRVGDAAAVVANLHQRDAVAAPEMDPDGARRRMLGDVVERRAEDAVERGDAHVVERERARPRAHVAADPGALGKERRLPADRRNEPEVIEDRRAQRRRELAQGADAE